ncbi:MAG: decarboxylase [Desulfobacteraceae bacterium]|nr:MAG: decarboxylase [Desulfobacteraceae bacterium]
MKNTAFSRSPQLMSETFLDGFIEPYFKNRHIYMDAVRMHGSPLYILEPDILVNRAIQFRKAFSRSLTWVKCFFAVKSNNLPLVSRLLIKQGYGLDVSSGVELNIALSLGADDIIFSGPGKTVDELELALANASTVTVLLDSIGELERLAALARKNRIKIRAGIRLNNNPDGLWRKFGIPLDALDMCYEMSKKEKYLDFCGLQFHSSWNLNALKQADFIQILGSKLKRMPKAYLESLKFIDIGGGYWPPQGEWLISDQPLEHLHLPADSINHFAEALVGSIREHILNLTDCDIYLEPGRWICNDAMHILITAIDRKEEDLVIADGGTNMVGWERFESDYFPVLNLSNPSNTETPFMILGSLCTPHDVWGYTCFGKDIQEGDILMIPTQGAYTYSLRQHFIKPLPSVVPLRRVMVDEQPYEYSVAMMPQPEDE